VNKLDSGWGCPSDFDQKAGNVQISIKEVSKCETLRILGGTSFKKRECPAEKCADGQPTLVSRCGAFWHNFWVWSFLLWHILAAQISKFSEYPVWSCECHSIVKFNGVAHKTIYFINRLAYPFDQQFPRSSATFPPTKINFL
jgi:hypothetical protein